MHEIGHSFGLGHNSDNSIIKTVMRPSTNELLANGPYREDIADAVEQYGKRDADPIKVLRTTDQALTWSSVTSSIPSHRSSTMPLSVSRDDDRMVMFYTDRDKKPRWAFGPNDASDFSDGVVFGGESSVYGTVGHGYSDEYMMAWVDHTDSHKVKVVRLTNDTDTRVWKNPPSASRASGTPAVHKLASNKWILTYPRLDSSGDDYDSGRIVSRISTDDGSSWGSEVELYSGQNFRALRGVSVTSDGTSQIRINFAQSNNSTFDGDVRAGVITTIKAHLNSSNQLVADSWHYNTGTQSATEASTTKTSEKYIVGYRGLNRKLISRNATESDLKWVNKQNPISSVEFVGPAVVARRNANWAYMFYLD